MKIESLKQLSAKRTDAHTLPLLELLSEAKINIKSLRAESKVQNKINTTQ